MLIIAAFFADYWGSNGRRESQGSLSSGTSLEMATSCSAGKIEVRFLCIDLHGNTETIAWRSDRNDLKFFLYLSAHSFFVYRLL